MLSLFEEMILCKVWSGLILGVPIRKFVSCLLSFQLILSLHFHYPVSVVKASTLLFGYVVSYLRKSAMDHHPSPPSICFVCTFSGGSVQLYKHLIW